MSANFPYTGSDYYSEQFKPTELHISKETISRTEKRHYRDEIEFLYIRSGQATIEINGTTLAIDEGDFIQLMPYHVNRLILTKEQSITIFRVRFSIGLLLLTSTNRTMYLKTMKNIDKGIPLLHLNQRSQKQVVFLCEEVYAEKKMPTKNLDSLHLSLISFLSYIYGKYREQSDNNQQPKNISWKALQYIQIHHQEPLSIMHVATNLAISDSELKKVLQDLTGFTFQQLLNQVRIRNAAALLQFEDLSISQIAKICGYQTEAYFYKVFQQNHHMTPLVYRQSLTDTIGNTPSIDAYEIATYLLENCQKKITLSDFSKKLGFTEKKINSLLQNAFQMNFKELLTSFRVQIGKTMLLSLPLSIQEVALKVGFSDSTSFSRNFKRIYGASPRDYLKIKKMDD